MWATKIFDHIKRKFTNKDYLHLGAENLLWQQLQNQDDDSLR